MQFGETVWAIYDVGWKAIRAIETNDELGRNFLPVILETEEEANKIADGVSFFEVQECFILPKKDTLLSEDDMKIFLKMLSDPQEPNDFLKRAAESYKKLVEPDKKNE